MTTRELHEDLNFVRAAVVRRERHPRRPAAILWMWALQVLVGYVLIDFADAYSGWYFLITTPIGLVISGILGYRLARKSGELDRALGKRQGWHWMGGLVLVFSAVWGLAAVLPALREPAAGQVVVVMIGLVYYFAGVHFDQMFLWLAPILIAGGITVGLLPAYGWTTLGAVLAVGLVAPTLLPFRKPVDPVGPQGEVSGT